MEIHIFGSLCRGEIDDFSDIDLLVIRDENEDLSTFDKDKFSIYMKDRIIELWEEGNPFAWHLFFESKIVYSSNASNTIKTLGKPKPYINLENDLQKFLNLFITSKESLINSKNSLDFDLSMVFLSIRNSASCFSLGKLGEINFSRHSAKFLKEFPLSISSEAYSILERSRLLSTRGIGKSVSMDEFEIVFSEFTKIEKWLYNLCSRSKLYE